MKIWNATEQDIREALAETGLKAHGEWPDETYGGPGIYKDGRALRLRLAIDKTQARDADGFLPYQRCSTWNGDADGRGRKVAAVCWHGHRDFMRALYRRAPEARIKTATADYRGADNFEGTYLYSYGQGNHYNLAYGNACNCGEGRR